MAETYTDDGPAPNAPDAKETKRSREAAPWLELLDDAQKYFDPYHDHCDKIDKLYADLEMKSSTDGDREFAMFWANLEVLKPTIYSRPPVPVVMPRFRKRKSLPRKAAEVLERALITDFEADDVDGTMRELRDDVATSGRGAVWLRYHADNGVEQASAEHLDRRDFLHSPARKWREVPWVARRAWLTRDKAIKRFPKTYQQIKFEERGANPGVDENDGDFRGERTGEVWEIWHKAEQAVVWVSPGCEDVLDIQDPYLSLDGFFPCPRPAYATVERGTLKPVPDFVYYKDQVEEINELTARISHLSERLRLQGFYASGVKDVGEAIEQLMEEQDDRAILIPVSNFAALGSTSLKDAIVWLPVREVAEVITHLVNLRKQIIDDVYQITGLSDIMRGDTQASETLGAQQLKAQYGSIRIRQKQDELVRVARDITRMKAEIMAEKFAPETLMAMSQVDDLPKAAEISAQIMQVQQQVQRAKADPQIMAQAQANPQMAQQILAQAEQQVQALQNTVTVEAVMNLLRAERVRPFVLEIETDSTIQPDEQAEKQRRIEFLTAVGGFINQAGPVVQAQPETAPFMAEALKFAAGGFRAGREMDEAIDEFAEKIKELPKQQKGPSPEEQELQLKAAAEKAKQELEGRKVQQADIEGQRRAQIDMAKLELDREKLGMERERMMVEGAREQERMGMDREKFAFEQTRAEADRAANKDAAYLKAGVPPGYRYDEDEARVTEALTAMRDELAAGMAALQQGQQTQAEALAAAIQAMTAALTAPKRVIRDQSGRAVGVETVSG